MELSFSARKRADIVAAAVTEFQRTGFDRTSMNQIAAAADVSKRTIYKHFGSKDELFAAIVQELVDRTEALPDLEYDSGCDLGRVLTEHAGQVVELLVSESFLQLARVSMSRFLADPTRVKETLGDHRRFQGRLKRWIQSAMDDGRLQGNDAESAASVFTGMLREFVFWPQLFAKEPPPSPARKRQIEEQVVTIFLDHYAVDDR